MYNRKLTDKQELEIIQKYINGEYPKEIVRNYPIKARTVKTILKKYNIPRRGNGVRKYSLDESFFDVVDTEEKAYILGFLYADGCNDNNNSIKIELAEIDKEHLNKINKCFKSNAPIHERIPNKDSYTKNNSFVLKLNSKHMAKNAEKLGCMPNKTFKLDFPTEEQVPSHLIRHFIRRIF